MLCTPGGVAKAAFYFSLIFLKEFLAYFLLIFLKFGFTSFLRFFSRNFFLKFLLFSLFSIS